jgi:hypothetical protein
MVSPIAEDWRILTEAQKVVVTCCTRFTNSNEASGDQKASWESKAAIQDKNNIVRKSLEVHISEHLNLEWKLNSSNLIF